MLNLCSTYLQSLQNCSVSCRLQVSRRHCNCYEAPNTELSRDSERVIVGLQGCSVWQKTLQKPYAEDNILSAHLSFLHYTNVIVHPCIAPLWYFITLNTKQPIGKNGTHIFWTHRGVSGPDNLTTLHHHCFLSMTVRLSIQDALLVYYCPRRSRPFQRLHEVLFFLHRIAMVLVWKPGRSWFYSSDE